MGNGWPPRSDARCTPNGAGRSSSASASSPQFRDHARPRLTLLSRLPLKKASRGSPMGAAHPSPRRRRTLDDRRTPPGPQAHPAPHVVPPRAAPPGRRPASVPVVLPVRLCPSPLGANVLATATDRLHRGFQGGTRRSRPAPQTVQAQRCLTLQTTPEGMRVHTNFQWWPQTVEIHSHH